MEVEQHQDDYIAEAHEQPDTYQLNEKGETKGEEQKEDVVFEPLEEDPQLFAKEKVILSSHRESFIGGKVRGDETQDLVRAYQCDIYQDPSKLVISNGGGAYDATFKLILIGNSGVGKSCIIKRIGSNSFSHEHEVTIGAEFTTIAAHVDRKRFLKLQYWDSCGQERFNSITRIFYRGSHCVVFVYEVNNAQSLRDLERVWIADVQANLKDAFLVLVGNKADVDDELKTRSQRQVSQEEALMFKEKHRIHYHTEVSAKTGMGIRDMVEQIAKNLYHVHKENMGKAPDGNGTSAQGAQGRGGTPTGTTSFQRATGKGNQSMEMGLAPQWSKAAKGKQLRANKQAMQGAQQKGKSGKCC
ncbi:hypothetical protein FGO68_gene15211 [Halteria grandinella]|uniref:Uncharacterized protein n=1 Tax=Halteria grandinella TaxID=5974 RepID=A0A8J8NMK3_HALGN|nr:hypothetical protein FGO68_gene15211 [Halteria grandinella]